MLIHHSDTRDHMLIRLHSRITAMASRLIGRLLLPGHAWPLTAPR